MDVTTLRIIATVVCFVVFIGILAWTFARHRKAGFHQAAHIPFNDE